MKIHSLATVVLMSLGVVACGSNHRGDDGQKAELNKQLETQTAVKNEALRNLEKKQQELDVAQQNLQAVEANLNAKVESETAAKTEALQHLINKEKELDAAKQNLKAVETRLNAQVEAETAAKNQAVQNLANKQKELDAAKQNLKAVETRLNAQVEAETAEKNQAVQNLANKQKELEEAKAKLVSLESEKQARLVAEEKANQEKQKIAEMHAKDNKADLDWFKSEMGKGTVLNKPYPKGFNTEKIKFLSVNDHTFEVFDLDTPFGEDKQGKFAVLGENRVYNQDYSSVVASRIDVRIRPNGQTHTPRFNVERVTGDLTQLSAIPTMGEITYSGVSIGAYGVGDFTYTIDFANKSGSGKVSNLLDVQNVSDVILEQGKLTGNLIESTAKTANPRNTNSYLKTLTGSYILGVYGPNAEEVAGQLTLDNIPNFMMRSQGRTVEDGLKAEVGLAATKQP